MQFTLGQEVTIVGEYCPKKRTITRIMKRFIECSDGTKWDHNGYSYPKSRSVWNTSNRLEPWGEQHRQRRRCIYLAKVAEHFSYTLLRERDQKKISEAVEKFKKLLESA